MSPPDTGELNATLSIDQGVGFATAAVFTRLSRSVHNGRIAVTAPTATVSYRIGPGSAARSEETRHRAAIPAASRFGVADRRLAKIAVPLGHPNGWNFSHDVTQGKMWLLCVGALALVRGVCPAYRDDGARKLIVLCARSLWQCVRFRRVFHPCDRLIVDGGGALRVWP